MPVFSKRFLSGASDGRSIPVTGVAPSTANIVHTAITGTVNDELDEVWVYAHNTATDSRSLTVRWAATATGQGIREINQTIAAQDGFHIIVPGFPLRGGLTVQAYATAADAIAVYGYVNRVT